LAKGKGGKDVRRRLVVLLAVMATGLALGSGVALSAPASSPDAQADGEFGAKSMTAPKVIGGSPVSNGEFRYVAALLDKRSGGGPLGQHFCGGTLIDRDSVLTAAHCFTPNDVRNPGRFRVLLGRAQLNDGRRGVFRDVKRIFRHPGFNIPNRDAAVLKLSRPVKGIPKLKLAPVSSGNRLERPGSLATVAGWGFTSNNQTSPSRMQQLRVPTVRDGYARSEWSQRGVNYVPKNMVASGFFAGKNSCQGDSGGPLIRIDKQNGKKVHFQIGIVSFGPVPCAQQGVPAVYAEVNSKQIAPFIKSAARR
jgi:secreted trypsin-like serine protease